MLPGAGIQIISVLIQLMSKAEISAKINGEIFSTGPLIIHTLNYQGQMRITYVVWISDFSGKKLEINDVILREPLILE